MRIVLLFAMTVLACLQAVPASASSLHLVQDNGRGSLNWHDGKDVLLLRSGEGKGIHVIAAEPAGILGLRKGDDILAVNGSTVDSIASLLDKLHASKSATAGLMVVRDGSRQTVTVAVKDYARFKPPMPPPPPPPPPPVSGW